MSKIKLAYEILQTMQFLNIPAEKYSELIAEHGSQIALHAWCAKQLNK